MGKKTTDKKLEFEFGNRFDKIEFDNPVESGNFESSNGSPRNGAPSPIAGEAAEVLDIVDAGNMKTKNGSTNQLETMVPESLIPNSSGENTESYNNWRQFLQVTSHYNMHPNFAPVSDSTHTSIRDSTPCEFTGC